MHRAIPLAVCLAIAASIQSLPAQEKPYLGKTTDGWAAQLKSSDAKARRGAAFALGKLGRGASEYTKNMKAAYAAEKDVKVREALVFALGEISRESLSIKIDRELETIFLGALADSNAYLRRSGAFSLGCLASKSAATRQALERALGDPEAIVRQNAAFALAQFAEDALPALSKALRDNDSIVKRDAASVLLTMSDGDKVHDLLKDLLPLCRDANSETRRAALNVLMRILDATDKDAIEPLRSVLGDKDIENRRNAALAMCNIGGDAVKDALPVLLEAARSGDLESRRQSVLAISRIGKSATSAVPDLMGFLRDDKDEVVRKHAAIALGGIGKGAEPAVKLLAEKIQDPREVREVRFECATALTDKRIDAVPAAREIVPILLDVLSNPQQDLSVRERVVWALRVHREKLRDMKGTREAFTRVAREPRYAGSNMLRYDCAYMLGMVWQQDAPSEALDVLLEFLKDDSIKIFESTNIRVGASGAESKGTKEEIKDRGKGDGRMMATDALTAMGVNRFRGRSDIMAQLRILANDKAVYAPLRKKAKELFDGGQ